MQVRQVLSGFIKSLKNRAKNGIFTDISIGDIYLSFPHDTHKIVADFDDPLQYDFFAFDTSDGTLKSELLSLAEKNSDPKKRIFRDDRISALVAELIGEIKFDDMHSKRMIENICEQIEVHIIRAFAGSESDKRRDSVTDTEVLCYRAMSYINSHIFSMKNLTEVSESINYNYSYLSNLFKKTTGQTMMDYYRIRRLETAKQLLNEKGQSITKIAEALNYSSVYAFSRAFKSHFGVSPHQYKTKQ